MKIDDKIRDEKLQYNINREAEKISMLLSGKIDKYEQKNLTGEEILPYNRRLIIEQANFAYQGKLYKKQLAALKSVNLSNKTDELKEIESIFPRNLQIDLNYKIKLS